MLLLSKFHAGARRTFDEHKVAHGQVQGRERRFAMYFAYLCSMLCPLLCVLGAWFWFNAILRWYVVDRGSTQLAGTVITSLRSGTAHVAREVRIPEDNSPGV